MSTGSDRNYRCGRPGEGQEALIAPHPFPFLYMKHFERMDLMNAENRHGS